MQNATALDKLLVSIINTAVVLVVTTPLAFLISWRYALVGTFLAYQLVVACTKSGRSLGQRLLQIYWAKNYPLHNRLTFAVLYSASFATIVVWLFFPFDLLLANLGLLQWPMVHFTGYTLHGYLSGKMYGVKKLAQTSHK